MSLILQGSTSGSITLQEPAVAGSTTISLPATTGTVVLQNGSNNLLMNSGYGSDAVAYGCRAWVNFNGTGTPAIRASGNVSSITDNGTGDYTVNFTTALVDVNYCVTGLAGSTTNDDGFISPNNGTMSTSAIQFRVRTHTGTLNDATYVYISVFR